MPLFTNDIEQARAAFSALEGRAESAEKRVQALQSALDELKARQPLSIETVQGLRQRVLDLEADKEQLQMRVQHAVQAKADLSVQNFIAALGLAAALGEATMPDRVVPSISATVQSYITMGTAFVGFHLFQPGADGTPSSLSSTSFEIAKVPPQPGAAAPRNFYLVLEDKQSVYTDSFWTRFTTASQPPSQPAADIVGAIAIVFANTAGWNFVYLLQSATAIATLEKTLSSLLTAGVPGDKAAAYAAAADSLLALTKALSAKDLPVAADLISLTASLDDTTRVARKILP